MAYLVAHGPNPNFWWRKKLPEEGEVTLGRHAQKSRWVVDGDPLISKLHATLQWKEGKLLVRKAPDARNAIIFPSGPAEECAVSAGEAFVIGETQFRVEQGDSIFTSTDLPVPEVELTCSAEELRQITYGDPDERIDALAVLPEIIRHSPSDEELESRVINVLLDGIKRADAVAIVRLQPGPEKSTVELRSWGERDAKNGLKPSRRLVEKAVGRRQSLMHIWSGAGTADHDFTLGGSEWAICAPLLNEADWALYICGKIPARLRNDPIHRDRLLKSDLKFAEVVAEIFGALRQVRGLQQTQGYLSRFFPQNVLNLLPQDFEETLRPRETEVTVLFCDLRGSSRMSEENDQDLPRICDRLTRALEIITTSVSEQEGVIGDFQGDAAMGFWGWPFPNPHAVERACQAALSICRDMMRSAARGGDALEGFACGIGIASGRAIAGRLGTLDQFKISVFGPKVNIAARLESMTKLFKTPILIDGPTADALRKSPGFRAGKCRRVAKVKPYGMGKPVELHELVPRAPEFQKISDQNIRDYEAALNAFEEGRWPEADRLLGRMPKDGCSQHLKNFMERSGNQPPPNWDGVIVLDAK
jgi:adenylate cyclase